MLLSCEIACYNQQLNSKGTLEGSMPIIGASFARPTARVLADGMRSLTFTVICPDRDVTLERGHFPVEDKSVSLQPTHKFLQVHRHKRIKWNIFLKCVQQLQKKHQNTRTDQNMRLCTYVFKYITDKYLR